MGGEALLGKAVAPTVKAGSEILRRRMWPDRSRGALVVHADELADRVKRKEESLREMLRAGPDKLIDLTFDVTSRIQTGDDLAVKTLSKVGLFFRHHCSPRRLVVLGEQSDGKTVLAVNLVLDEIRFRAHLSENDRSYTPVPVRVNATGWDGKSDFTDWLASRVGLNYGLNLRIARALVDTGRVLPVLDGLDGMDPASSTAATRADDLDQPTKSASNSSSSAALDRLNGPPWNNRPVVLTCRTETYNQIQTSRRDDGLYGARTITLGSLEPAEVSAYLQGYRDYRVPTADAVSSIANKLTQGDPDETATSALRKPLYLCLAAAKLFPSTDINGTIKVLDNGAAETDGSHLTVQDLNRNMIPVALQGVPRSDPIQRDLPADVTAWMCALAKRLEPSSPGVPDHRQNEPCADKPVPGEPGAQMSLAQILELTGTGFCRYWHGAVVGVIVAIVAGLMVGAVQGLRVGAVQGLLWGVGSAVLSGILAGLWAEHRSAAPKQLAHPATSRPLWPKGLLAGVGVGLLVGVGFTLAEDAAFGICTGLAVGIWAGWWWWSSDRAFLKVTSSNRFAWRVPGRSRWHWGLLSGLVVGPVAGFMFKHEFGPWSGLAAMIVFGVVFTLAAGRAAGLAYGLIAGVVSGFPVGLPTGGLKQLLPVGWPSGIAAGFAFFVAAALVVGLSTKESDRLALGQDARRVLRDDAVCGVTFGCVFMLALAVPLAVWFGTPFVHQFGVWKGGLAGLAAGLPIGLAAGLTAGLLYARTAARHLTNSLLFFCNRRKLRFPLRAASILEWAHDAGLLRVIGIDYQFRDGAYRNWLATPPTVALHQPKAVAAYTDTAQHAGAAAGQTSGQGGATAEATGSVTG